MYQVSAQGVDERIVNVHYYFLLLVFIIVVSSSSSSSTSSSSSFSYSLSPSNF